jgi:hypothetical protein
MASMIAFISVTALLLGATNAQTYKIGSKGIDCDYPFCDCFGKTTLTTRAGAYPR